MNIAMHSSNKRSECSATKTKKFEAIIFLDLQNHNTKSNKLAQASESIVHMFNGIDSLETNLHSTS